MIASDQNSGSFRECDAMRALEEADLEAWFRIGSAEPGAQIVPAKEDMETNLSCGELHGPGAPDYTCIDSIFAKVDEKISMRRRRDYWRWRGIVPDKSWRVPCTTSDNAVPSRRRRAAATEGVRGESYEVSSTRLRTDEKEEKKRILAQLIRDAQRKKKEMDKAKIEIESMGWEKIPEKQRKALTTLGYDQAMWDDCHDLNWKAFDIEDTTPKPINSSLTATLQQWRPSLHSVMPVVDTSTSTAAVKSDPGVWLDDALRLRESQNHCNVTPSEGGFAHLGLVDGSQRSENVLDQSAADWLGQEATRKHRIERTFAREDVLDKDVDFVNVEDQHEGMYENTEVDEDLEAGVEETVETKEDEFETESGCVTEARPSWSQWHWRSWCGDAVANLGRNWREVGAWESSSLDDPWHNREATAPDKLRQSGTTDSIPWVRPNGNNGKSQPKSSRRRRRQGDAEATLASHENKTDPDKHEVSTGETIEVAIALGASVGGAPDPNVVLPQGESLNPTSEEIGNIAVEAEKGGAGSATQCVRVAGTATATAGATDYDLEMGAAKVGGDAAKAFGADPHQVAKIDDVATATLAEISAEAASVASAATKANSSLPVPVSESAAEVAVNPIQDPGTSRRWKKRDVVHIDDLIADVVIEESNNIQFHNVVTNTSCEQYSREATVRSDGVNDESIAVCNEVSTGDDGLSRDCCRADTVASIAGEGTSAAASPAASICPNADAATGSTGEEQDLRKLEVNTGVEVARAPGTSCANAPNPKAAAAQDKILNSTSDEICNIAVEADKACEGSATQCAGAAGTATATAGAAGYDPRIARCKNLNPTSDKIDTIVVEADKGDAGSATQCTSAAGMAVATAGAAGYDPEMVTKVGEDAAKTFEAGPHQVAKLDDVATAILAEVSAEVTETASAALPAAVSESTAEVAVNPIQDPGTSRRWKKKDAAHLNDVIADVVIEESNTSQFNDVVTNTICEQCSTETAVRSDGFNDASITVCNELSSGDNGLSEDYSLADTVAPIASEGTAASSPATRACADVDEAVNTNEDEHSAICVKCGAKYLLNICIEAGGIGFTCQDIGRTCLGTDIGNQDSEEGQASGEQPNDEGSDEEDYYLAVCYKCATTHIVDTDIMALDLDFCCSMVGKACEGDDDTKNRKAIAAAENMQPAPGSRAKLQELTSEEKKDLVNRYDMQRLREKLMGQDKSRQNTKLFKQLQLYTEEQKERYRDNEIVTRKGEKFIKINLSLDPGPGCRIGGILGWRSKLGRQGLGIKKMSKEEADRICISNKERSHVKKCGAGGYGAKTIYAFENKWSQHTAESSKGHAPQSLGLKR